MEYVELKQRVIRCDGCYWSIPDTWDKPDRCPECGGDKVTRGWKVIAVEAGKSRREA